jgi:hypothetical protein
MDDEIRRYNEARKGEERAVCAKLAKEIGRALPENESKIWHGHPVWFLDGNPIAGYDVLKDCVRLLFWSGASFDEKGLTPSGSFKAAEARYTRSSQIDADDLARWLAKSKEIQWDYKNLVRRKGELRLLKRSEPAETRPNRNSAPTPRRKSATAAPRSPGKNRKPTTA